MGFDERVERAVARAWERARRRGWQDWPGEPGGKDPKASGKHVFFDTLPSLGHLSFTLPCNPANFCTENTVGQVVYTETVDRGFFGYAHWLYASIE